MRAAVLGMIALAGCSHGEEEYRREREAADKANAAVQAERENRLAPFRALEQRYKAGAKAIFEKIGQDREPAPGIEKARGRKIAPFLRSKIIPNGEQRSPSRALWCVDPCDAATWIASDPATARTIVVADVKFELLGNYVNTRTKEKQGDAYDVIYTARAVLVPEQLTVAIWERHGSVLAGYSQYEGEMPIAPEEFEQDMAALADGRAPAPKGAIGRPYTRY